MTDYIPHSPHPKQAEFLALETREAMYGGAAGGGKSDALLMDALKYVHIKGYAALLLRRTYQDLAKPGALIDRSKQWLMGTDARWNEQQKRWTFPSGAVLDFGYLEHEDDKYHYQGAEYQFIGFDELTQFLETQYTYLFSRCRRPSDLSDFPELAKVPLRVRSATNPGGIGHEWVKERFAIQADGLGHNSERPFVPAKLEDNPSLDAEEYEIMLSELDLVTRSQLRYGDWNIGAMGNVFDRRWWRYYDELPVQRTASQTYSIIDTAGYDDKTTGDFAVIATVARYGADLYWLDVKRGHWTFPELEQLCVDTRDQYGCPVLIEQTPWANPLIQTLQRRIGGVIAFEIKGRSKLTRAQAASPYCESGNFFLPRGAPWVAAFVEEHGAFPFGPHDDMVDTTSMAALRMLKTPTENGRNADYRAPAPQTARAGV